ncbi:Protein BHLHB9 [Heterocephalus glaber]|uniref:Protein BHLHB9 n=1 Tax=Heterocephalus glaber TaxID=10181 RepID=G5ARQ6_HETGA|nr:Protein BHLHB9 [Heterocephalus glaber]
MVPSEPKAPVKVIADVSCKAENEVTRSMCKDKAGIKTWFWAGEEANISCWFWKGEEAGNHSSTKDKSKADTGAQVCAEKLESVAVASCKSVSGVDEEEEENVIRNWFWEDGTNFDPEPKLVQDS